MEEELWQGIEPESLGLVGTFDGTNNDPTVVDPTIADPTATDTLRKRRVQVKLTAERLLSEKGLPYLLKHGPKRVRISRKRKSAYNNLSHIIQFYQLWAHELFPKAKFKDFLKLCHTLGKSDKVLREYRTNLYRYEMGTRTIPEGTEQSKDDNVLEDEDGLYSVSAREQPKGKEPEQEQPPLQMEEPEFAEDDLDTQYDDFDEAEIQAMKGFGFF